MIQRNLLNFFYCKIARSVTCFFFPAQRVTHERMTRMRQKYANVQRAYRELVERLKLMEVLGPNAYDEFEQLYRTNVRYELTIGERQHALERVQAK